MPKVGDTVRFLNSVGGGIIERIEGQIAYVDEDGFLTPVLLRECVTVTAGDSFFKSETRKKPSGPTPTPAGPSPKPAEKPAPLPPAEETPEGEKINLVLGFEPADIKHLSSTSFDAYFVNDSNYAMYVSVSTREASAEKWTLRFAGFIEPATEEFAFELLPDSLPEIDRIAVQAIPFKRDRVFALKPAVSFEQHFDATKFVRLHCFVPNPYFDAKVIAIDIVKNDVTVKPFKVEAADVEKAIKEKKASEKEQKPKISKSSRPASAVLEIDLHAAALLDNLNGLSKADILNYQIDTFRKVMDENLTHPGRKIVFIHGKGEGVLRQALMKELNYRYKGHEVSDASFREYGFGATQVTIRNLNASQPK